MADRLEQVVTSDISGIFNSKDSFLWFGLFARFIEAERDDKKFSDFLGEFTLSLHSKVVDGISFDDLSGKATKDKSAVLARMRHLEKLMKGYLKGRKV